MAGVNLITNYDVAGSPRLGHVHYAPEGASAFTEAALPPSVVGMDRRPTQVEDQFGRRFISGQFSRPLIFTEFLTLHEAGMVAPLAAPGLAAVAGGVLDGNNIGYLALRHKNGDTIIHESNLSPGSTTISLDGTKQRQWTIPATFPEAPRATHVVLFASVDGALPKEVVELVVGTITYTDNVTVAALGDPPPVDPDGNLRQARGIPPYARFVVKYHRRSWWGGDPRYPSRWWYSELDEFESVGSLNYLEHLEKETVVGAGATEDFFLSCGTSTSYGIQGWDESDFSIAKVDPSIGTLSHFGIVNIGGVLWVPTEFGVDLFVPGAGYRPLMHKNLQSYWQDEYKANPAAFENCIAANDGVSLVYKLLIPYATAPLSRYFVGDYQDFDPRLGGEGAASLPDWSFDYRDRKDYAMGSLRLAGRQRSDFYTGSCDAFLRQENVESNDDDDGDTYGKVMLFDTPHYTPGLQAGDANAAYEFTELDLFIQSEEKDWTIEGRAGDDSAYLATAGQWRQDVKATRLTRGNKTAVAQTAVHFAPRGLSGKGVMFRVRIPKAKSVEYRGLALKWNDGTQTRPFI
jgi:hypothetical protein